MKKHGFLFLVFLLTMLVGSSVAGSEQENFQARRETDLRKLEEVGVLGSVLSITTQGNEPLIATYGYADIEKRERASADRLYQVGSQTKMFTAAALLILRNRGKLKLDDAVSDYVAGAPRAGELTIRQLLQHTGGIGDSIVYFDPPKGTRPDFEVSFENHLFLGRVAGEQFPPGERWEYNNLGFVILGKVIEAASGQSLSQFVRRSILEPLEMNDTYLGSMEPYPESRMARGYFKDKKSGLAVDTTLPNLTWASSAGDMVSSAGDLRKWAQALLSDSNPIGVGLEDFTADAIALTETGNLVGYGLGFMKREIQGRSLWGHGGFIHGYVTLTLIDPSSGTIVQLLTNRHDESDGIIAAVEDVVAHALDQVPVASADTRR
ncbi:MAG: serine hydrolase domain-containing protein [Pseudomonadota bacterium]